MPTYRFVHAADLHLDSPFKGLKRVAPEIGEILRKSTFEAFDAIIDLCMNEEVDALLVAGDVFDSADRSLAAQLRFVDGLRKLEAAGIQSFVCHGNHDPLDAWQSEVQFPDNCLRFGSTVTSGELRSGDPESPLVYGYSYPTRDVKESVIPEFEKVVKPGRISIGLLHANVGADTGHESYAPCTVDDLNKLPIRYWALGHVHTRQEINLTEGFAVYPGNTQGRHSNETGARGVYLVTIAENGEIDRSFRPVDVVRWDEIEVDISDHDGIDSCDQEINREIEERLQRSDGRNLVFRVHLTGRGPLHNLIKHPEYPGALLSRLNNDWSGRKPFAYCERVTANTRQEIDREDLIKRDDFIGDLLRFFDEARGGDMASEIDTSLKQLYERARLRQYISSGLPQGDELAALLDEAESICLDLLIGEGVDED